MTKEQTTNWAYYPRSVKIPEHLQRVIQVFRSKEHEFKPTHGSNSALAIVRSKLETLGYTVEAGKKSSEKISVPVLFGNNGSIAKYFEADAWHKENKVVLEVEAGRGYANNQFLKDLFQACMMNDIEYCVIAVRNKYRDSGDFEKIVSFFDTLYSSNRMRLPLKGALIIGYGDSE